MTIGIPLETCSDCGARLPRQSMVCLQCGLHQGSKHRIPAAQHGFGVSPLIRLALALAVLALLGWSMILSGRISIRTGKTADPEALDAFFGDTLAPPMELPDNGQPGH